MNLVAIVAIVSNARALLNEWRDIPLVAAASDWYRGAGGTAVSARDLTLDLLFPAEACWSLGAVVACAAALLLVERVAAQVHRYDALWHGLRAACVVATLALPLYCVSLAPVRPGTHAAILLNGCVAMMKMLSYAHTNAELRRRYAARARAASARRRRATGFFVLAPTPSRVVGPRRVGSMDALTRGASFGDLGGDVVFPETPKDPRSPPTFVLAASSCCSPDPSASLRPRNPVSPLSILPEIRGHRATPETRGTPTPSPCSRLPNPQAPRRLRVQRVPGEPHGRRPRALLRLPDARTNPQRRFFFSPKSAASARSTRRSTRGRRACGGAGS